MIDCLYGFFKELWMEWIKDEKAAAESDEDKIWVLQLYSRAVHDLFCKFLV